jgi:salicylate hydroxylase
MKKSDQQEDVRLPDIMLGCIGFHRADVQTVLLKNISANTQVHLNRRLVSYRQSGAEIELHFRNGETATCDILVGADGVHSIVRKGFLAKLCDLSEGEAETRARPVWSGSILYRSMIDSELIRKEVPDHPCLTDPVVVRAFQNYRVTQRRWADYIRSIWGSPR